MSPFLCSYLVCLIVKLISLDSEHGKFLPSSFFPSLTHSLTPVMNNQSLSTYVLSHHHSLTHSLTHSLVTLSLTHSLTHSLVHSLTHSHTHTLTHSHTHSLTHSLNPSFVPPLVPLFPLLCLSVSPTSSCVSYMYLSVCVTACVYIAHSSLMDKQSSTNLLKMKTLHSENNISSLMNF